MTATHIMHFFCDLFAKLSFLALSVTFRRFGDVKKKRVGKREHNAVTSSRSECK